MAHLLLVAVGIVLYAVWLIFFDEGATVLDNLTFVMNIAALISCFIYLFKGYKKNAAIYYKVSMWFLLASEIIEFSSIFSKGLELSVFSSFVKVLTLVAFVLLVGAKDYGKVKSNIISLSLVALTLYTVISLIPALKYLGVFHPYMIDAFGQLILASSAALMVCGKYLDKAERGAK